MGDGAGSDASADRRELDGEPVVPLDDDSEAEVVFTEFQQVAAEARGFRALGTTVVEGQTQTADLSFAPAADAFEGTVEISEGAGASLALEIIRATGLTWIKGPASYWETLGYPPEGAGAAEGMYVVFEIAAGDAVAQPYDYAQLLEQTGSLSSGEVSVEGLVQTDGGEFYRYVLGEGDDAPWLELPADGDLDSARYISAADGVEAEVLFEDFGSAEEVEPPSPDEVLREGD